MIALHKSNVTPLNRLDLHPYKPSDTTDQCFMHPVSSISPKKINHQLIDFEFILLAFITMDRTNDLKIMKLHHTLLILVS